MPRGTSRYDEARLQGRLWTPREVRTDLGSWHDFGDLSTISLNSSAVVQSVTDKSGRGVTLTEATKPPTWSAGALFGRPGVIFNGASRLLNAGGFSLPSGTDPCIFTVGKMSAGNTAFTRVVAVDNNGTVDYTGVPYALLAYDATPSGFDGGNAHGTATLPGGATDYDPHMVAHVSNGNGSWVYIDGTPGPAFAFDSAFCNGITAAYLRLGSFCGDTTHDMTGVLSEVIIAGNRLSVGPFRQKIEGYLAWKWGLVNRLIASHPYKNRPPTIGG